LGHVRLPATDNTRPAGGGGGEEGKEKERIDLRFCTHVSSGMPKREEKGEKRKKKEASRRRLCRRMPGRTEIGRGKEKKEKKKKVTVTLLIPVVNCRQARSQTMRNGLKVANTGAKKGGRKHKEKKTKKKKKEKKKKHLAYPFCRVNRTCLLLFERPPGPSQEKGGEEREKKEKRISSCLALFMHPHTCCARSKREGGGRRGIRKGKKSTRFTSGLINFMLCSPVDYSYPR